MLLILSEYLPLSLCHESDVCLDDGLYAEMVGQNDTQHPLIPLFGSL
jgi:hypothetical protein